MPRLLIIEDEPAMRTALVETLRGLGYRATSASTGPEGLEKACTEESDLILLDVMLPGLDGYQVVEAIKGEVRTRHIPIILITGLDDYGAETRGRDAGAEDFLSRPVDRADLSLRIRKLLPPPAPATPS